MRRVRHPGTGLAAEVEGGCDWHFSGALGRFEDWRRESAAVGVGI